MALDVLITTDRISKDPIGREFIEHVDRDAQSLGLDDAALYYDFPIFSDYETVPHRPDSSACLSETRYRSHPVRGWIRF